MTESEVLAAFREIKELLQQMVTRFDVQDTRLDAMETQLDAIQGMTGSLAGAQ